MNSRRGLLVTILALAVSCAAGPQQQTGKVVTSGRMTFAEEMKKRLQPMVDAGQLELVVRKGRMTLKLSHDTLFPAGGTRLKKAGKAALVSVAQVLQTVEGRDFLVAGHTDNVPMKEGSYGSNWDLSTARAVRVVKLMVESGVAPERLAAAGFGEFDPTADNTTPAGRAQNRRLEIILMPKVEELRRCVE